MDCPWGVSPAASWEGVALYREVHLPHTRRKSRVTHPDGQFLHWGRRQDLGEGLEPGCGSTEPRICARPPGCLSLVSSCSSLAKSSCQRPKSTMNS